MFSAYLEGLAVEMKVEVIEFSQEGEGYKKVLSDSILRLQ